MRHQYNFLSPMRERVVGGGGGKDKLKDRGIQTDGRTDGPTDERTNRHTHTDRHLELKCNNVPLSIVIFNNKINLIKGNSSTEEFLIYIFEIKHSVLTESNNKVTMHKRI